MRGNLLIDLCDASSDILLSSEHALQLALVTNLLEYPDISSRSFSHFRDLVRAALCDRITNLAVKLSNGQLAVRCCRDLLTTK